jgi:hypothetical protein
MSNAERIEEINFIGKLIIENNYAKMIDIPREDFRRLKSFDGETLIITAHIPKTNTVNTD